ncbi:hypothetical protein CVV26_00200 [Candidatus Kuenenbacteria bacterium HGW-Kuenenbacteria-1]|uniref:Uncharacterized protein n=1 Tax=Candidatus Kuenenbacteria bacterium HGW-Kuenenbacteria-1 TaxID=2013812 RepID=A0A2N1UP52_9BACT|nr:MAG: hypothetical protein CVV26_00200 [Candidatus Kuenenbacteria bacterium HGW-Kuenenbacteria-1]
METILNNEKESEFKEAREIAVKFFLEKLGLIKEFKELIEVGETTIIKEADVIIYQNSNKNLVENIRLKNIEMPFEIGLGDIEDRKIDKTHLSIVIEVEEKLKQAIRVNISGLLWLDKNKKINLAFNREEYEKSLLGLLDAKYFQETLNRYEIEKLWMCGEKENKEIFERMKIKYF